MTSINRQDNDDIDVMADLYALDVHHNGRVVCQAPLYVYDYEATLEALAGINGTFQGPEKLRSLIAEFLTFIINARKARELASKGDELTWLHVTWERISPNP